MWFFMGFCAGAPENLQHRSLLPTIPCEQFSKEEAEHPNWKYCKTLYLSCSLAPVCCFQASLRTSARFQCFQRLKKPRSDFFTLLQAQHTLRGTEH